MCETSKNSEFILVNASIPDSYTNLFKAWNYEDGELVADPTSMDTFEGFSYYSRGKPRISQAFSTTSSHKYTPSNSRSCSSVGRAIFKHD